MIWGPSDLCLITCLHWLGLGYADSAFDLVHFWCLWKSSDYMGTCIDSSGDHELYVPVWRSEDLSSRDFWIFRMYLGFSMHPFKGVGVEMLEMWMPVVDT
ncbi:hypothetical protein CFP56_031306 [Quercus suber]|uniref:Uncharacterized protein n=2 Tax=Quercus suber TaxID=58331 RepID=A0AAW0JMF9_QUESU